jgi:hypothetical protein
VGIIRRHSRPKLDARARVRLQFDAAVLERGGTYTEVDDLLFLVALSDQRRLMASLGNLRHLVELGQRDDDAIRAGVIAFLDSPPKSRGLMTV